MLQKYIIQALLSGFLFQVLLSFPVFSQKNDTVYLLNGDRITGEVKRYENSVLVFKTDAMSTVNIEYIKVRTFQSAKFYEIVTKTGFSYYGSVKRSDSAGFIDIVISNDTIPKAISEIVEIKPIKHRFWKRFSGSVDVGFSFYKSTQTLQYYLNSNINYRAKKYLFAFDMSLLNSKQEISDSVYFTKKNDVSLYYNHYFQGRWWGGFGCMYQQNTELALDYRIQGVIGAGYDIVRTNPIRFYTMGGLLVNREKSTDSASFSTNFEGLMSAKFTWLQLSRPDINFSTNLSAIPSFTINNRWRLEYDLSIKYEVFKDFTIGLAFYDNYDSKPTGGGPALNDWSVVFSVGYTF